MKLEQFFSEDELLRLKELVPTPAPATPSVVGVGKAPTMAPQPGQAAVSVDPMAAQKAQAMAAKQIMDQKKQLQDQIKAKEKELMDLRKQLAGLR
jgi:hypothetical protein